MRSSCINHPENEPLVIIKQWQLDFCDGDTVAAFIIGAIQLDLIGEKSFSTLFTYHDLQIALLNVYSTRKIKKSLKALEKLGVLIRTGFSQKEIVRRLRNKTPQDLTSASRHCEWCGCKTFRLQNHHYPITAKDKGTSSVYLCANCHDEYHFLKDSAFYSPTSKLLDLFERYPLENEALD